MLEVQHVELQPARRLDKTTCATPRRQAKLSNRTPHCASNQSWASQLLGRLECWISARLLKDGKLIVCHRRASPSLARLQSRKPTCWDRFWSNCIASKSCRNSNEAFPRCCKNTPCRLAAAKPETGAAEESTTIQPTLPFHCPRRIRDQANLATDAVLPSKISSSNP